MIELTRRSLFAGLAATIAAPAIVRASSLMGMPRVPLRLGKTATLEVIASQFAPGMIWRAQMSDDGKAWREYAPIDIIGDRGVLVMPDASYVRVVADVSAPNQGISLQLGRNNMSPIL